MNKDFDDEVLWQNKEPTAERVKNLEANPLYKRLQQEIPEAAEWVLKLYAHIDRPHSDGVQSWGYPQPDLPSGRGES